MTDNTNTTPEKEAGKSRKSTRRTGRSARTPRKAARTAEAKATETGNKGKTPAKPKSAQESARKKATQAKPLQSMQTQVSARAGGGKNTLRIIPLGGLQEIGKNITALEYGNDIVIIDCGVMFPKDDQPGIDLVVPDMTYLEKNQSKIRGLVLTHGHEDHIGSVPFLLRKFTVPVYGTELTNALVGIKLKEHRLGTNMLHVIAPGEMLQLGKFKLEFIHVNHSIAGALAIAIHTPIGTIIHTGDFKIDYTPVDSAVTDLGKFAELGSKGVLLLMGESTNAERPGYTMSERTVGESMRGFFSGAKGRVIVAMFASNVHRVQQVADLAMHFGRKIALVGRSLLNVSKAAMELGLLHIPEGRLIEIDDVDRYDDDEIVILTTGSQGETMAGLTRMSVGAHQKISIRETDTIILSATPIPGNERARGG